MKIPRRNCNNFHNDMGCEHWQDSVVNIYTCRDPKCMIEIHSRYLIMLLFIPFLFLYWASIFIICRIINQYLMRKNYIKCSVRFKQIAIYSVQPEIKILVGFGIDETVELFFWLIIFDPIKTRTIPTNWWPRTRTCLFTTSRRWLNLLSVLRHQVDGKPSQLLRSMKQLANNQIEDKLLIELFQKRLPAEVQMVLAAGGSQTADDYAKMADKILEVRPQTFAVNSINNISLQSLESKIEHLSRRIDDMSTSSSRSICSCSYCLELSSKAL